MEDYIHPEFGPIYPFNYFHGIFIDGSPICTKEGEFGNKLIHHEDILNFIENIKEKTKIRIGDQEKSFSSRKYDIITLDLSTAFDSAPKSIRDVTFHKFLGFCITFKNEPAEKFTILLSTLGLSSCSKPGGNCVKILKRSRHPLTSRIAEVSFPDKFGYEETFGGTKNMTTLKLKQEKKKNGDLIISTIREIEERKLKNLIQKIKQKFKNHFFKEYSPKNGEELLSNIPSSKDANPIEYPYLFFFRPEPHEFLFHNFDFRKSVVSSSFAKITKLLSLSKAQTANCQSFAEALLNLIFNPETDDHKKIEFMVKLGFGEIPREELPQASFATSPQSTLG